jgi:anti-sigma B factor antagonist
MIQEVTVTSDHIQVALSGSIYVKEAHSVKESLFAYIDKGHHTITIDLSAVDYIDGYGLGSLLSIHKWARKNGGNIEITGLQGHIKSLFELTKMDKVLKII